MFYVCKGFLGRQSIASEAGWGPSKVGKVSFQKVATILFIKMLCCTPAEQRELDLMQIPSILRCKYLLHSVE